MTLAAGWLAVVGGSFHLVITPLQRSGAWSIVAGEGVVNTVTLKPSTPAELAVAEAFWLTPGSFAVPLLLLGAFVVWSSRRGQRVPGWLGWGIGAWGAVVATMLPASPAWLFLLVGGLIVLGDRRRAAVRGSAAA